MRRAWVWLVVGMCLALVGCASGQTGAVNGPVPTATLVPMPTATVEPLQTPLPSQGWVTVPALRFAQSIAFAASDALTGYACGYAQVEGSGGSTQLAVSVTHDGGRTWSTPGMITAQGGGCDLSINPTNPNDLVVDARGCFACDVHDSHPYRSHDGGKTWTALAFDPTQWTAPAETAWVVSTAVWIGNTAYFAVVAPSGFGPSTQRPQHAFVANTQGALLSAPNDAIYSIVTNVNAIPYAIWAHGSMLVVQLRTSSDYFVKSTDAGARWQIFTPAGMSPPLQTFDGVTGEDSGGGVYSFDGGLTWSHLPGPLQSSTGLWPTQYHTADGSILAIGPQYAVWLLAPGAPTWTTIGSLILHIGALALDTFSTDGAGHPILAWGIVLDANGPNQLPAGLEYHGLS
jgi:hypothetical protein